MIRAERVYNETDMAERTLEGMYLETDKEYAVRETAINETQSTHRRALHISVEGERNGSEGQGIRRLAVV